MKYSKPELTLLARAVEAVQGISKTAHVATDAMNGQPFDATLEAYEADE